MKREIGTLLKVCIILSSLAAFVTYVIFKERIVGTIIIIVMLILIIIDHKLEK